jgi:hypothetical protein
MLKNFNFKIRWLVILFGFYISTNCGQDTETPQTNQVVDKAKEDTHQIQNIELGSFPYAVQVAAFAEKNNAEKLASVLEKSDLNNHISTKNIPGKGILYRVWVGPFREQAEADKALSKIKKLGYSDAFIITGVKEPKIDIAKQDTEAVRLKPEDTLKQLTSSGGCQFPEWSPAGREIAFFKRDQASEGIFSIGTGGGYISQIIVSRGTRRITPKFAWSPSGNKIAFVAIEESAFRRRVENLYLINKDGSSLTNLISQDRNAYEISDLNWAPDGRRIAFNANYGRVDAHSDIVQKVKIVHLNKNIEDLAFAPGTQWCAGWESETKLVFLSTYAGMNYAHNFEYKVWSYDVNAKEGKKILLGPAVKNCQSVKIIPNKNKLVYSSFTPIENRETGGIKHQTSTIQLFNLITGNTGILFESSKAGRLDSRLLVSKAGDVFFFYDDQIWRSPALNTNEQVQALIKTRMATVSPEGKRLCFVEKGDLFIVNLTNQGAE